MNKQITSKRLAELELAERKLRILEDAGVDNWEGYEFALKKINKEQEQEKSILKILQGIEDILSMGCFEPSERGAGFAFTDESAEEAFVFLKNSFKQLYESN